MVTLARIELMDLLLICFILEKYENTDLPNYKQPEIYKEDLIVCVFFRCSIIDRIHFIATRNDGSS